MRMRRVVRVRRLECVIVSVLLHVFVSGLQVVLIKLYRVTYHDIIRHIGAVTRPSFVLLRL